MQTIGGCIPNFTTHIIGEVDFFCVMRSTQEPSGLGPKKVEILLKISMAFMSVEDLYVL